MKFILDTNVVSELVSAKPSPKVLRWMEAQSEDALYLSAVSLAEIIKGVERLPASKRKSELRAWVDDDLIKRFDRRILPFDAEAAWVWGRMVAKAQAKGRALPLMDSLLAAQAIGHHCRVATRNEPDFDGTGAETVNPWEG